jgi:hypothetical protein
MVATVRDSKGNYNVMMGGQVSLMITGVCVWLAQVWKA